MGDGIRWIGDWMVQGMVVCLYADTSEMFWLRAVLSKTFSKTCSNCGHLDRHSTFPEC